MKINSIRPSLLPGLRTCLCALFIASADVVLAMPVVSGTTLSWDNNGWYQVQSAADFTTVCEGGQSCVVPPGNYIVINHSTNERWEGIVVGTSSPTPVVPDGLTVTADSITWPDDGWYQVQRQSDFSNVCQGGTGCVTGEGTFVVINHSTGARWDGVVVGQGGLTPVNDSPIVVDGSSLSWPDNGWYQVQNVDGYVTVCSGGSGCTVDPGTYQVINHSTGERWENIVVEASQQGPVIPPVDPPGNGGGPAPGDPVVDGNSIVVSNDGYYQFQSAADFTTLCEGVTSCAVDPGFYNVINLSTGMRWDGVQVGDGGIVPDIYAVNPADPFNALLEFAPSSAPADGSPSVPQHLRVELIGNNWVELNWAPSADNGEVVAYNIYRDDYNVPLYVLERDMTHPNGGVQAELNKYWQTSSFIDCNRTRFRDAVFFCNGGPNGEAARGPDIGSRHTYRVSSVDNLGNESGLSDELTVQLFDTSGSPLPTYFDPFAPTPDAFPFDANLASPDNFISQFDLIFEDDFNGAELDSSLWNSRLTWGPGVTINGEKQYFVDILNQPDFGFDPFSFTGSTMKISAVRTPDDQLAIANNKRYLSGALSSYDKFGFTYGYVESRIKVSGVFGLLSTFYLYHRYPANHAPEIDIVEYLGYNQFGDEDMFQTYHYRDSDYGNNGLTRSSPTMSVQDTGGSQFSDDFHTFGMLWEPGLVVWYIDGIEVKRLVGPQISRQRMNLVTYLVTGSSWTKAPDEYLPSDELVEQQTDSVVNLPFQLENDNPLEMEIDYIRVWQRPEHQN